MRSFALVFLACSLFVPHALAQPGDAGGAPNPPSSSAASPSAAPASEPTPSASATSGANDAGVTSHAAVPAAPEAPSAASTAELSKGEGIMPRAAALAPAVSDDVRQADAWVAFEHERDKRTRAAESFSFTLMLGLQGALAVAYAVAVDDVPKTSTILAATTAGLSFAAILPTLLAKTRRGKRAWFSAGSALFAFGAGATFATAYDGGENKSARWVGASVALGGLAFLPVALIQGFPEEEDYAAYRTLPDHERRIAAAKLLARIDRFEQRVTAIALYSAVASAAVLCAGALVSDDKDQARTLGGLSLIPIGTVLAIFGPRLFVRDRVSRFAVGDAPTKLPFNAW